MSTSIVRKQTSFILSEDLICNLQKAAVESNRSLNDLVEGILKAFISERPNEITLAAMKEAETSDSLESLDMSNFRGFVDSL